MKAIRALACVLLGGVLLVPATATAAHAAAPTVSGIEPTSGPVGTTVAVSGSALSTATGVRFGNTDASFTVVSDTQIDAVVPRGATTARVFVTTPEGTATSAQQFTVTPPAATQLTIGATPRAVVYGTAAVVTAELRTTPDGVPVAGRAIGFYSRPSSTTTWRYIGAATTSTTGVARLPHRPWGATEYTARHSAAPAYEASASGIVGVRVAPRVSARFATSTVQQYNTAVVAGWVAPAHGGQPVYLQMYAGSGVWRTLARTALTWDGRYRFAFSATRLGEAGFRVVKTSDSDHLNGISNGVRLAVVRRTLRAGMSGADVAWVQRQLVRLRHDVPRVSGYFDFDTLHGVYAFQKLHRLPRTGVVDDVVRARLAAAGVPRMAWPRAGRAVEIDKTRQVLLLAHDGVVIRVLDVSTGNGQPYYSEGRRYIAVTPEGSFSVTRKINGMRVSHLGELWKPSYFYGGYAIHGSRSVPVYPASHGCVRITMPAADRVFSLLPVGTHVRIYRS